MKIKAILTMLIMLGGACMYALPDTADAARLGGGRSFGSRPSMSQPAIIFPPPFLGLSRPIFFRLLYP